MLTRWTELGGRKIAGRKYSLKGFSEKTISLASRGESFSGGGSFVGVARVANRQKGCKHDVFHRCGKNTNLHQRKAEVPKGKPRKGAVTKPPLDGDRGWGDPSLKERRGRVGRRTGWVEKTRNQRRRGRVVLRKEMLAGGG